jgi:hypothetical protein
MKGQLIRQNCSGDETGIRCPVSEPSVEQKHGLRNFISFLISCCPYTMLGRKVLQFLRGETGTPLEQNTNREIQLKSNIKIGYGIMLIGIFCPIFWISFLSGARGNELMFNAVHSFLVFLFGLGFVIIFRIQLRNEQAREFNENP